MQLQGSGWYFGGGFLVVWAAILRTFSHSVYSGCCLHFCECFPSSRTGRQCDFCLALVWRCSLGYCGDTLGVCSDERDVPVFRSARWWRPSIQICTMITSPRLQEDKSRGFPGLWEAGSELLVFRMCDHSALHPGAGWHGRFDDDSLCLGYQYKVSLLQENQARREL